MKVPLTAKLKLHTDAAQFKALRATQLAYRDGLNYVSRYAFEHGNRTGRLSIVPDVSSDEVKAARRQRHAELRWSLDTSPAL